MDIDGALALVTGAGGGIGRATALALARRGARVLCTGRDLDAVGRTAALCGDGASSHRLDVTDRAAPAALAAEHDVDILVNNAGVGLIGGFTDMTAEDWEWIRATNLDGVVHGCAAFVPGMLARGRGHIVNVSSGLAYLYPGTATAYVCTKAAVLALSRSLRADLAGHGVGVTAICPGVTDTPIVTSTRFSDGEDARARSEQLFRRGHPPAAVAAAIVRAIERNRPVVPVGREAWLGWWLNRYLPLRAHQALVARLRLT